MSGRCVIVSGGDFSPFREYLRRDDFIIACDHGYAYCRELELVPDLLIADFDSYSGVVPTDVPVDRHIPEKDDTDTMLAVRYAVGHGFDELLLCCALGGRLDHTMANLQALVWAQKHHVRATLRSEDTEVISLEGGSLTLPRRDGWSLSLFAADGPCRGVCIRGAKYPLRDAELLPSLPLGVSNEWAEEEAEIAVAEGILLIVQSRLQQTPAGSPAFP